MRQRDGRQFVRAGRWLEADAKHGFPGLRGFLWIAEIDGIVFIFWHGCLEDDFLTFKAPARAERFNDETVLGDKCFLRRLAAMKEIGGFLETEEQNRISQTARAGGRSLYACVHVFRKCLTLDE